MPSHSHINKMHYANSPSLLRQHLPKSRTIPIRRTRTKRGHEKALASRIKENPKVFYPYIKSKRVARERVGPLKDRGGNLCVEPEEMGEVLNEYFASVFTKEKDLVDDEPGKGCVDSLSHVEIEKEEVLGFLRNIKVDKSPGPDGIYPRILKKAREEFAGALREIFVSLLATGEVTQ